MTKPARFLFLISLILIAMASSSSVTAGDYLKADPADLQWWRDAKFGLFIHWGPVSLKGTEIGWSRGGERRGRKGAGEIPAAEYDNLYQQFNPVKFNAAEWVATAKSAGMKYLVFTTKHHDGFCMFDSRLTDYKITSPLCPFGRDVVADLAKACHDAGIRLGFYYSPVDWYHPDYRTENHARYIKYMHGQVEELCRKYAPVDILWFDGLQLGMSGRQREYPAAWAADWDSHALFKMIRGIQPHILINNRAGLPADFDTPEQQIGRYQTDRPWESCITMGRQWAWKPNDNLKSVEECLQTLIRVVGGDGNLLFNVGPMPTGEIEPRQVDRLKEMGSWLQKYGKSLYGTRGGPYPPGEWGVSTQQGDTVYLHILKSPGETLKLPHLERKIVRGYQMSGGTVRVTQEADGISIAIPPEQSKAIDTIVVLDTKSK